MAFRNIDVTNGADTSIKQKFSGVFSLEEIYLMPSLQHASMSKVAITLWNQADIKHQIVELFSKRELYGRRPFDDKFLQIVHKVLENLLRLDLPNYVRKMVSNIVYPIGKEIFVWITYQDDYVFHNTDFQIEKSIAINYLDDLVWTPRGKINYKQTGKTLLANGRISCDLYKYNIACAYCLEDDVSIIAPKVLNTTLKLKSIETQAMVYFWTAQITGDFTELDEVVATCNSADLTDYSTNEYIFAVLIDSCPNEVAIKYIWDKLSHEEQSRRIASAIAYTSNNDFRCLLLSQISKEQEKEVFVKCYASKIALHFLGDWLWGHYFLPTLHNMWDVMSEYAYVEILEAIVKKMESSHEGISKQEEYKATFREVWKWAPKRLKVYVFEECGGRFVPEIFFELFDKKNMDIIQSFLFDLNDVQKKVIIFSGLSGIFKCEFYFYLITSNQLNLLEWLVERTLFCREDVECFKQSLMDKIGKKIAAHFIQNEEWNNMQQFLKWAFISDDHISVFKLNLASTSEICPDILKCIVKNNNADFIQLDNFFEWCTSGNAEGVIELKRNMLERRGFFDTVICKLILEDKYELLEKILNWCFVYDPKHLALFKQSFYQDDQIYKIEDLIVHLIKQDDQLQTFKKFVYYGCSSDEEINKFKTCILHPKRDSVGVCTQLLSKKKFTLADELLIWCCNSSQIQINDFKNRLMIHGYSMYRLSLECYDREVIRWFNPSLETMIRVKEIFRNYRSFERILPKLDIYALEKFKIKL